jgi:predicted DNA-binding transcriptional regulator AlpA
MFNNHSKDVHESGSLNQLTIALPLEDGNKLEILTVAELASMLKMNKRQVHEMTRERTRAGAMRENPIPVLKITGNVRFRKSDIEAWLEKCLNGGNEDFSVADTHV